MVAVQAKHTPLIGKILQERSRNLICNPAMPLLAVTTYLTCGPNITAQNVTAKSTIYVFFSSHTSTFHVLIYLRNILRCDLSSRSVVSHSAHRNTLSHACPLQNSLRVGMCCQPYFTVETEAHRTDLTLLKSQNQWHRVLSENPNA